MTSVFLFLFSFILAAVAGITVTSRKSRVYRLEGDPSSFDPSVIASIRKLDALSGDIDDDQNDDFSYLYGSIDITGESSKSVLSGDIDDLEDQIDDEEGMVEGALFGRLKKKIADRRAKRKTGFKNNLLGRQAIAKVLKNETNIPVATAKINQIAAMSKTPGALLSTVDVAPVQVTGGRLKQTETDLKIPGKNFANAIVLWEQYYPGLSRSETKISSGATLTYTFVEPTAGDVTQVQVIIITLAGSEINKLKFAEVTVGITGLGTDGVAITKTRDRVEIFSNDDVQKTAVVMIPYKRIKETLFAVPYASPTTANPIVVTLGGVPSGVSATVRLSGMDDEDWKSYKAMVGLV